MTKPTADLDLLIEHTERAIVDNAPALMRLHTRAQHSDDPASAMNGLIYYSVLIGIAAANGTTIDLHQLKTHLRRPTMTTINTAPGPSTNPDWNPQPRAGDWTSAIRRITHAIDNYLTGDQVSAADVNMLAAAGIIRHHAGDTKPRAVLPNTTGTPHGHLREAIIRTANHDWANAEWHLHHAWNLRHPPAGDDLACAWTDYRDAYGVTNTAIAHAAFVAGWKAAQRPDDDIKGALR